ncbi:hypothetical protein GPECTOR_49g520 [Gonium pectorale]|uniref:Uncharacterized protein n=1 Tax=Gonium pectorale TaxID=33097 RepID=A0A150G7U1_GONPE|nr:hypothetical protein GPECTOR_49g520 [Gonium pectorale]|eukprot:KXZ45936.1 hypothetical protein GPECTOR_49g520 [Gonium pectorale]
MLSATQRCFVLLPVVLAGTLKSIEEHVYAQAAAGLKLPGMAGSMLLGKAGGLMVPFAAQQAMNMSSAAQVQSGAAVNSLLIDIYRFWRSQAPMD